MNLSNIRENMEAFIYIFYGSLYYSDDAIFSAIECFFNVFYLQ